jgi:hypothetical protein
MPYTAFDATKPDATTQNGTQFAQSARDNLKAIRDAALMGGGFFGWPLAISGGTAEQPTTFIYSSGTERVRAVITWGTTGGATGNPQTVVYSYSSNSGGAYDTIGTKTITYDASGNVTATSWS